MTKLTAKNFGCLKDFDIELQPLHALIGPNDSGKSTILRALHVVAQLSGDGTDVGVVRSASGYLSKRPASLEVDGYGFSIAADHTQQWIRNGNPPFGDPLLVKLVAEHLRQASPLIPDGQPLTLAGESGATLASLYDALNNRNPDAAHQIRDQVRKLFPTIDRMQLQNTTKSKKALKVLLRDGTEVGAEFLSEGLLYYLAFAALPYLDVTGPILIEEPENGLHPARIREVMGIIKEVSKTSQVVIATHSPLVINELEPEQVSIITRDGERGSKATPMTQTKNFQERSKVYALGELWLSYADGEMEKDLVSEADAS